MRLLPAESRTRRFDNASVPPSRETGGGVSAPVGFE